MSADDFTLIEIHNASFRLGLLPQLGGCLTHVEWQHPSGGAVDLMRRTEPAALSVAAGRPSLLACFPMVPFANRLDAGRVPLPGSEVQVPLNRPGDRLAIHGFSRTGAWSVVEHHAARVRLKHEFAVPAVAYVYSAEQSFVLEADAVHCTLSVTNQGDRPMPFGIGFHPWFDRTPRTLLRLQAAVAFRMDQRQMPIEPVPFATLTGGHEQFVVGMHVPFDTPAAGWDGRALITWPERRTRLALESGGALKLVHLYAPREPAVVCVEPVSHLPDVVNRRALAQYGDMTWLAPGESLAGTMRLVPEAMGE